MFVLIYRRCTNIVLAKEKHVRTMMESGTEQSPFAERVAKSWQ